MRDWSIIYCSSAAVATRACPHIQNTTIELMRSTGRGRIACKVPMTSRRRTADALPSNSLRIPMNFEFHQMPIFKLRVRHSAYRLPIFKFRIMKSDLRIANSELLFPLFVNSEARIPNFEFRISNSEFRIPNFKFRISNSEAHQARS